MKTTASVNAIKFEAGQLAPVNDSLTVEEAVQVCINDIPYTITMRTPGDDYHLVRGLLYTEEIYVDLDNGFEVFDTGRENDAGVPLLINIKVKPESIKKKFANTRGFMSVSSCGLCGKRKLEDIEVNGDVIECADQLDLSTVESMFATMNQHQLTFNRSGGAHAAAAVTKEGELLSIKEDVGRHNAVDKVIGELIEKQSMQDAACLLVSGRISYEIVTKAFMAKIPFLAAVSAPSSLAVETAEAVGICIIGFCRDHKATAYSLQSRIKR